jgi:hypothetical protein
MVSSQGVRQLCPEGVFTSAPAGSDSNRTAAVGGDEFRKFRLGTDAEQAATVNPHAMTAMTRLIITPPLWRLRAAIPRTRPCRTVREGSTHRKQSARYGLKCDGDKVQWDMVTRQMPTFGAHRASRRAVAGANPSGD